ncbi:beta-ketoacyl-[acyl-carrier-protein] synthase I [Saccharospirillum sp. MSK14-1]|uniref:beta-ketoacyl synthase N-terminal-like domain-containing protein n=1 Tax=Saccharospirillum sp. MSK14-1 TaxID=1897632 RepID=UPI000D33FA4B|nr:beta-ketoacyl synthase N-terminal-like domain-containing protein [Saccharospirillum sp. MSK14-1]PTY37726.1 beta-ketoacyl-[acyl-carrier-protein] synthase I [Saccharospirillum sp. MSK14-1]
MRRVVITGMGITSCLGNEQSEVLSSLREGRSGIRFQPDYQAKGLRCQIAGSVENLALEERIPRKLYRFMGDAAAYSYIAMEEAINQAGLSPELISHPRTGLLMGSGGASTKDIVEAADILRERGVRRVGPYRVTSTMGSTVSACLSTAYGIKGMNATVSSACATSAHCIGYGSELIQWGKQDIVFVGGGEAEHWSQSVLFDAMGAFPTHYNEHPTLASRPYDAHREGFVIAGGGGVMVLEEREHALQRGATILAEVTGYGTASDGYDMVAPSGDGAKRAMTMALDGLEQPIDYINTHGTSTQAGDLVELQAMQQAFGKNVPPFSSTKSLTGHALGAAGIHEAIYSVLMLRDSFIAASANIDELDPGVGNLPLVRHRLDQRLNQVMSNSFGFGGTNVSLVFGAAD